MVTASVAKQAHVALLSENERYAPDNLMGRLSAWQHGIGNQVFGCVGVDGRLSLDSMQYSIQVELAELCAHIDAAIVACVRKEDE